MWVQEDLHESQKQGEEARLQRAEAIGRVEKMAIEISDKDKHASELQVSDAFRNITA